MSHGQSLFVAIVLLLFFALFARLAGPTDRPIFVIFCLAAVLWSAWSVYHWNQDRKALNAIAPQLAVVTGVSDVWKEERRNVAKSGTRSVYVCTIWYRTTDGVERTREFGIDVAATAHMLEDAPDRCAWLMAKWNVSIGQVEQVRFPPAKDTVLWRGSLRAISRNSKPGSG